MIHPPPGHPAASPDALVMTALPSAKTGPDPEKSTPWSMRSGTRPVTSRNGLKYPGTTATPALTIFGRPPYLRAQPDRRLPGGAGHRPGSPRPRLARFGPPVDRGRHGRRPAPPSPRQRRPRPGPRSPRSADSLARRRGGGRGSRGSRGGSRGSREAAAGAAVAGGGEAALRAAAADRGGLRCRASVEDTIGLSVGTVNPSGCTTHTRPRSGTTQQTGFDYSSVDAPRPAGFDTLRR